MANPNDYKAYVFPLLFFRRLSDVWDEDFQDAFEETDEGYATAIAADRFVIPDGAHWKDARNASRVCSTLTTRSGLPTRNRLQGVFGSLRGPTRLRWPTRRSTTSSNISRSTL
ncbi:MAG: SAM-dependent DNA methyltransferase [bacterium]|nr:SAM-dependent DNA methyltransferase [bacterium]